MGRVFVLAVLLAMMLGLRALSGAGEGAHDPLILAAIGFVVMASFTAAELGSMLTLPRVSGYIGAGLLLGPSAGNILSASVVEDMTMFNTLALGLIATGAGLELDLKALRALRKTLAATVGAKVVLSAGGVAATFLFIESTWSPLGLATPSERAAVALVLGVLSVGTSPAIALAVINESGARGRLADLTLGAAVMKDVVLVVLLAVAIAVCQGLLGLDAGEGSLLATLGTELGGSVLLGAALGLLIIGYVRFVREEMLLFVAGLVLASAELSRALHLDLLLVFIAAGFVVRNFSNQWEEMLHAIETVALPVFVVFFTIAGARIDLDATLKLLPVAGALCAMRAGAFYASARVGAHVGRESSAVRRWAWLAYLPQAGVTLGLLGLAVEALGPVGKALGDIGVACVALNLAVGPVTMRRALQATNTPDDEGAAISTAPSGIPPADPGALPGPVALPPPQFATGAAELDGYLSSIADELDEHVGAAIRDAIRPHVQDTTGKIEALLAEQDHAELVPDVHVWALGGHGARVAERAYSAAASLRERSFGALDALPYQLKIPFERALSAPADGEGWALRLRKFSLRLRHRLGRTAAQRTIPLRAAARVALGPRLAGLSEQLATSLCRAHSRVLGELERGVAGQLDRVQIGSAISDHLDHMEASFRSDATTTIRAGLHELLDILATIGSPSRPLASLRYSEVEPEVRARREALDAGPELWGDALSSAEQRLQRETSLARLRLASEHALDRQVLLPLAEAADALEPVITETRRTLSSALEQARGSASGLPALIDQLREAVARRDQHAIARADLFRAAPALLAVSRELHSLVDAVPEDLRILAGPRLLHEYVDPADAPVRVVHPHADAQRELIQDFIPVLDLETRRAAAGVQDLDARLGEVLEIALSAARAAHEDETLGMASVEEAFERALTALLESRDHAHRQLISAHDAIAKALVQTFDDLARTSTTVLDVRSAGLALARPLSRLWSEYSGRLRAQARQWQLASRRFAGFGVGRRFSNRLATPHDMRALLSRDVARAVPASYARLFQLEPEQDMRLCVGLEREIAIIVEGLQRWRNGQSSSVLVVGDPGSGRTTLLNLVQPEITAKRMLRPESVRSRRAQGLTSAIAYELGLEDTSQDLASDLTREPTAVLVDDLEHWFTPDASGADLLRSFLELVRRTRHEVFWIVSVSRQTLAMLSDVLTVEDVFGDVVHIDPLTATELRRVITLRHSLSGLSIEYPSAQGALLDRLLRGRSGELVFRVLHVASDGNPSTALSLWINSVRVNDKRATVLLEQLVSQRLPELSMFDTATLALLVQLLRFGPMSAVHLAESLGSGPSDVHRTLTRLRDLGLVKASQGHEFRLALEWRGTLATRLPGLPEWR